MNKIEFCGSNIPYTLGVELEFQLLNNQTFDLSPKSLEILKLWDGDKNRISPEIFQSMIEINSKISNSSTEAIEDLKYTFQKLISITDKLELQLSATGTHPFANYLDRILHPSDRYEMLIDRNQIIARRLVIFGVHIHLGCRNGDHFVDLNNFLLHFHPILLALSASSPYWLGYDTGLASSRILNFESLPTGGHPIIFQNWDDFNFKLSKLFDTESITSLKDLWWDARPNLNYGTLELRIFDGINNFKHLHTIIAFTRCLCDLYEKFKKSNHEIFPPTEWLMRENKWRAARHGLDAKLIHYKTEKNIDIKNYIIEILSEIPESEEKNIAQEGLKFLLNTDPNYTKQRKQYLATQDLRKVTESLTIELRESV